MKDNLFADLNAKVALITGAGDGLGAYYAKILADYGVNVIITGRSSSSTKLDKVVNEIISSGNKASKFILDMLDVASFDDSIAEIYKKYGSIDILINNAAISNDKALFEISTCDWDIGINTNLKGLFFLTQAVAKQMKNQPNGGSIINIGAINGQMVRKNTVVFGTSKAGVIHLTKLLAYELIQYKIRVNCLSLGLIESNQAITDFLNKDDQALAYLEQIPAKVAGKFEDLKGPILLLSSNASSYMYGSVINVDGGFSINTLIK